MALSHKKMVKRKKKRNAEVVQAEVVDYGKERERFERIKEAQYLALMEERNKLADTMTREEISFCLHYLNGQSLEMARHKSGIKGEWVYYQYPKIQQYLKLARQLRELGANKIHDQILAELQKIVNFNLSDAYGEDGELLPINQMPRHVVDVISEVEVNTDAKGGRKERVKFYDKLKALDMLARHTGFYEQSTEVGGGAKTVFTLPFNGRNKEIADKIVSDPET